MNVPVDELAELEDFVVQKARPLAPRAHKNYNRQEVTDEWKYTTRNTPQASCSLIEHHITEEEGGLHGDTQPYLRIKKEKPEHRLMIYLKVLGHSNREIAEKTDFSEAQVSQVLRQDWARKTLLDEYNKSGKDAVQMLLVGEAKNSIWKLVEQRDNPTKLGAVVISASNSLLDRLFGKPNQPIEHNMKMDLGGMSDEELLKIVSTGGGGV